MRKEGGWAVDDQGRMILSTGPIVSEQGGEPTDELGRKLISPESDLTALLGPGGGGGTDPALTSRVSTLESTVAGHTASTSAHNLIAQLAARQAVSEKNLPNGYAGVDETGKIPTILIPATAGTPSATTTTEGTIRLAGDLLGTAQAPLVPGLLDKLAKASNLSDLVSPATARVNLGLGTAALRNVPSVGDASGTEAVLATDTRLTNSRAPTTHTHAQADITNLTTDLAAKASLASPTFTGTPAVPTAAADTATTQVASTGFVLGQAGAATPLAPGTASAGTSARYARQDHVHPSPAASSITFTPTASIAATTMQTAITELESEVYARIGALEYIPIRVATASTTAVLADALRVVEMNVATANNFTVPLNAGVAFPIGTTLEICQVGAGRTTLVAADPAVLLREPDGLLTTEKQWATVSLRKRGTDEWVVTGRVAA